MLVKDRYSLDVIFNCWTCYIPIYVWKMFR